MSPATGAVIQWSCAPRRISAKRLLRAHKYTRLEKVRPAIRTAADNAVKTAARLSAPRSCYVVTDIESISDDTLTLANGVRFNCPAFAKLLAGCERLLAFIMTLGPALDAHTVSLIEDRFEPLDALFLETSGWLTIESAVRSLTRQLRQDAAREGWRLSPCLGPGHDYRLGRSNQRVHWALEEQAPLFRLFSSAPLPVTLLPSCAMQPKISRSGVFGLRPGDPLSIQ